MATRSESAVVFVGPHAAAAAEIFDVIEAGGILRPSQPLSIPGARVLTDLKAAGDFAWRQFEEGTTNWTDLRTRESAALKKLLRARADLAPLVQRRYELVFEWIFDQLQPRLDPALAELLEDVAGDLDNCVCARLLNGAGESGFFEQLWNVYRQGGWPCGWEGAYPGGNLVLYQPTAI
jgi:hypothetical protein